MTKRNIAPIVLALRQRRKLKELSQVALSERMGYGPNIIWSWETGYSTPSLQRLIDWAQALDLELTLKERDGQQDD